MTNFQKLCLAMPIALILGLIPALILGWINYKCKVTPGSTVWNLNLFLSCLFASVITTLVTVACFNDW